MSTILLIGWNDLRIFLRVKSSYIWLFVVPVLLIGFMGVAFRGAGEPGNLRPAVVVEKLDTNYLAKVLKEELGKQSLRVVEPTNAEAAVSRIRIPADFTSRILSGQQARIEFVKDGKNLSAEGAMVELRLARAVVSVNSHLLAASAGGSRDLTESAVRQAQCVPAAVTLDAKFAGRKPAPVGFSFSLPGNMAVYIMMNLLIFGASSVAQQRRGGIVRRLACTPIHRLQLVSGKILGLVLLGGVQAAVYLLAGRFLFHVQLGANLGAILVTLVVYSWVAASLGVLAGSVVRAEDKVIGVCVLAALLMGALGGGWWPLELGPEWCRVVAHCIPTGWALDALHQLISFGGGFPEILRPLGVLALFGVGANALAAWLFRW